MSALTRLLAASPAADVETVLDLLASIATPHALPVRLTIHAEGERVFVRLAVPGVPGLPAAPGYAQDCARLAELAARWGHSGDYARSVLWAELSRPLPAEADLTIGSAQ